MAKEAIKDFYGRILGWLDDQGSRIIATDFYGRRLGYYDSNQDATYDFYGRRVCSGNGTTGLIMSSKED